MSPIPALHPPVHMPEQSFYDFVVRNDATFDVASSVVIDGASGETMTREALKTRVLALASSLKNIDKAGLVGLKRGSTVTVFSPNSMLYPVIMLALVCYPRHLL